MQPLAPQPFATWHPELGIWETTQLDLFGRLAPYSETWPTSGMTRNGSAYQLPMSVHRTLGFVSSSSRTPLFRTPTGFRRITRRREPGSSESSSGHHSSFPPSHRPGTEQSNWLGMLEGRIGDTVVVSGEHLRKWGKYASAIARWEHITGRKAPMPSLLHESGRPRPAPYFLEWLMVLGNGWATNPDFGLSGNQQVNALGNGALPLQAITALRTIRPF